MLAQCMSKVIRRSGRAVSRLASVSTKAAGDDTGPSHAEHTDKLTRMYYAAPVNGLINKHNIKFDAKGDTTLEGFVVEEKHCHTAGSLHGSCYFKLLDDAAFFASQARVRDFFVLTSAFNTVFMRPVGPGTELVATGTVTSASKALLVAHSELRTKEDGKLVASGSGTFMKHPVVRIADMKF